MYAEIKASKGAIVVYGNITFNNYNPGNLIVHKLLKMCKKIKSDKNNKQNKHKTFIEQKYKIDQINLTIQINITHVHLLI